MNLVFKRCLLSLACIVLGIFGQAALAQPMKVKPAEKSNPERVLFVGNSYYYYNNSLHNHVSNLVKAADPALGAKLQFKSATIGGSALHQHNIAHLTEPGRIGVAQPFQWVVMQGGSGEPLSAARREVFRKTVAAHADLVKARGGQVALYMTHVYVKPHKQQKTTNFQATESLYVEVGNEIGALVIPVGLAFEEAYRRDPDLKLHHPDGTHPSLLGTYLAACTTYAVLYAHTPVGNVYRAEGAINEALATWLQQVAQDVVTQFFQRQ